MKALVVFESEFGNTARVAQAIADAMRSAVRSEDSVDLLHVKDVGPNLPAGLTLLVVGCPTQRFSPMPSTKSFLKRIPNSALTGRAGCRLRHAHHGRRIRRVRARVVAKLADVFGYAADPIAGRLKKKGGELIALPEGFYVGGTEGPLLEGELERAAEWGRQLAAQV